MRRRALLAFAAPALLAGCGFQLRQAPDFAFRSIYIGVAATSPIGRELKRAIASGGKVVIVESPAEAEVVMDVLNEQRQKVVVGLGAVGQVREFELRMRLRFRLRSRDGRELIPDAEIVRQQDISYSETVALAKEDEEQLVYRSLQADIVRQVMRRLSSVKAV
ncbi:LPS-assembly lipoprotein LptE [Ramlibacter sp. PS4R-6]|uniref:LPS-assembly lipoprotein LptE n=1 Tax=Ramlibacter sp. PS4R-6 TaxID=3133438 RepID=UPI003099441A